MEATAEDVFPDIEFVAEYAAKRETCSRCRRPMSVCWCPFLPNPPLQINTRVVILQHPYEEKRSMSTTLMLTNSLKEGVSTVIKGARFSSSSHPVLREVLNSPNTVLLYPSKDAVPIESLPAGELYNLVVLDGTWSQARGIYGKSGFLHDMKKVKVTNNAVSKYVVRTQPTDECLSTLESVALALQVLEGNNSLYEVLTRPLTALCDFQLDHGAVVHQSKEYLIKKGLYKSQKDKT